MIHPLTHKLQGARGKVWGDLIKRLYYAIGHDLAADAREISADGTMTAADVGILALRYNLPVKTTFEYLQELPKDEDAPLSAVERTRTGIHSLPILPSGTYSDLKNRGMKATEVLEAAREQQS